MAAEIPGYTPPALSQMITSLEKETSIRFLYRSHYGIRLTSEGKRLLPAIQKTVQQYEELHRMEEEIKGLEAQILGFDPFVAVLPANHTLAGKTSVSLQELKGEPYLLLEEGNYNEPLEAFRSAGISPNIRLRVHDDYSILSMVEQGLGYSLLAKLVLRKTACHVATIPVEEPIMRTMALITKEKRSLSFAAKTFMQYILDMTYFSNEEEYK